MQEEGFRKHKKEKIYKLDIVSLRMGTRFEVPSEVCIYSMIYEMVC